MNGIEVLDYPYHQRPWKALGGAVLCAALALYMAREARGNVEGMDLEGVIPLGPHAATAFLWVLALVIAIVCVMALLSLETALRRPGRLVLTETELRVPPLMFPGKLQVVRLVEITQLQERVVKSRRMLEVRHRGGRLTVLRSMLPEPQNYERLLMELGMRVPGRVWRGVREIA